MDQNLSQYKIFYEVAKAGNISKAAKELYISPSTLSKAITSLEGELGFSLFLKSGRNSILSEYGKEFIYFNYFSSIP